MSVNGNKGAPFTELGVSGDGTVNATQLLAPDGAVSAPGISFADDTDCGIYRSAANTIRIGVGGAQKVIISTSSVQLAEQLDVYNDLITNSGGALQIGTAAATGHALATGGTLVGGALEVDGKLWLDGDFSGAGSSNVFTSANGLGVRKLYSNDTDLSITTGDKSGGAVTQAINITTGANTNAGDVVSGAFSVTTGATTTDGDTGAISLTTGVAGAGSGDAGVINLATHGAANIHLQVTGAGLIVLPTVPGADPSVAGALWNNSGVLTVSAG